MQVARSLINLSAAIWVTAMVSCAAPGELPDHSSEPYDDDIGTSSQALMSYDGLSLSNGLQGANGLTANGLQAGLGGNGLQVKLTKFHIGDTIACKCNLVCSDGASVFHPMCCVNPGFVPPDSCK